jgi:uncharacterized membrane protein
MVSTPKAAKKPAAVVVRVIVAIAVWVIIRIVCVGISVRISVGINAKMYPSVSSWGSNKHHDAY